MSGQSNDSFFDVQSTIDSAKQSVDDAVSQLSASFDVGVRAVSKEIFSALNTTAELKNRACTQMKSCLGETEKIVAAGAQQYKDVEDIAISYAKVGIKWGIDNPTISYSVLGAATVLTLPFSRRLLYRATIGKFQNAENIYNSNLAKLETIKGNSEKFALEITKLEERRLAAEAEYKSSITKLKATRDEFQRLSSAVSKNQRAVSGVLEDLRTLKQFENSAQARSEAATKFTELKSAAASINKSIYRINIKDI